VTRTLAMLPSAVVAAHIMAALTHYDLDRPVAAIGSACRRIIYQDGIDVVIVD